MTRPRGADLSNKPSLEDAAECENVAGRRSCDSSNPNFDQPPLGPGLGGSRVLRFRWTRGRPAGPLQRFAPSGVICEDVTVAESSWCARACPLFACAREWGRSVAGLPGVLLYARGAHECVRSTARPDSPNLAAAITCTRGFSYRFDFEVKTDRPCCPGAPALCSVEDAATKPRAGPTAAAPEAACGRAAPESSQAAAPLNHAQWATS